MTKKHIAILAGVTSSLVLGAAAIFLASPSPAGSLAVSDTATGSTEAPLPVQAKATLDEDAFVTIPSGTYTIGCDESGNDCRKTDAIECPKIFTKCRSVEVDSFDLSLVPVSTIDYEQCVINQGDKNYSRQPKDHINLEDINGFITCLNSKNSEFTYFLPSPDQLRLHPDRARYVGQEWTSQCQKVKDILQLRGYICASFSCQVCTVIRQGNSRGTDILVQENKRMSETYFQLSREVK